MQGWNNQDQLFHLVKNIFIYIILSKINITKSFTTKTVKNKKGQKVSPKSFCFLAAL